TRPPRLPKRPFVSWTLLRKEFLEAYTAAGSAVKAPKCFPEQPCRGASAYSAPRLRTMVAETRAGPDEPSDSKRHFVGGLQEPPRSRHAAKASPGLGAHLFRGNLPQWTITDFAALALGAVTVPIYSTQTAEQTSFILNDSGARVIALSSKHQLEKVLTIQRHTPVERIVVM